MAKSRTRPPETGAYVALLRGINVGGKNKLPMRALAEAFSRAGCTEVATYIQSGNVVFRASSSLMTNLPSRIAEELRTRHGIMSALILRTADELAQLPARNPYLSAGAAKTALHVGFLATQPTPAQVRALDPQRSPDDAFHVSDREIFLHLPQGVARTKLTNAYFDSVLRTTCTVRNWRTLLKLIEWSERMS